MNRYERKLVSICDNLSDLIGYEWESEKDGGDLLLYCQYNNMLIDLMRVLRYKGFSQLPYGSSMRYMEAVKGAG